MIEQYDEEIICQFIPPDKRPRYRYCLPRLKHRPGLFWELISNNNIDARCIMRVGKLSSFMDLTKKYTNLGYYIWSLDDEVNGLMLSKQEVIDKENKVILVYCPKLKIGYYQGELGDSLLLQKLTEKRIA